ncbi:hypothetical protein ACLKA7_004290 [Drosophila subpalustris]
MNPSLSELLQQAQRLANEAEAMASHPVVERTLPQVLRETEEMHARLMGRSTQSQEENTRQAGMMLGLKGIDLQLLTDKVENLDMGNSFEPSVDQWDTDVAGFLKNKLQNEILELIEETNSNIFKTVEKRRWHSLYSEWEEQKKSILNGFSENAENSAPRTSLNSTEMLYAKELISYNNCQKRVGNLLGIFTQLAENNIKDAGITKMWRVLRHVAKQSPLCPNMDAVRTRQGAPQFLQRARLYLELGYRNHLNEVIQHSRSVSKCGGIPSIYSKVKSFVAIKFQQPQSLCELCDVSHKRPLWPHVFYSLRCGDPEAAVQFLRDWNDPHPDLRELIQHQDRLKADPDTCQQSLRHARMHTSLSLEFSHNMRLCSDPYKKAVFAFVLVIGPVEPHCKILTTIEDYLWMQLTMCCKIKQLNIDDLQSTMSLKYGMSCLTGRKVTPSYFQLLVLTGHFEAAIESLNRSQENSVHAVHMAIALNELNILGMPSNELDPLLGSQTGDDSSVCRLNVLRLVITYAARFEKSDTNEALNYYYLLRHFKSTDGHNLMLKCIGDFVLKNCTVDAFNLIFGKADPYNPLFYSGGIFDKLPCSEIHKSALASMVATELTKRCEYEWAIEMHLISGELKKAMRLTCSRLAETVHLPKQNKGLRKMISRLNLALTRRSSHLDLDEFGAFKLLIKLMHFFDFFHAGKYREALQLQDESQLIPQSCQQISICLSSLKVLGGNAVKVLPNVLLAAMKIVFTEYQKKNSPNIATKLQLKERAKALINFVATLPYRLPLDANKRLVQMELEMQI